MSETSFVVLKQCINCFHLNDKDKNSCGLCGFLMTKEIVYESEDYQDRFKRVIDKKFSDSADRDKESYDISDLDVRL